MIKRQLYDVPFQTLAETVIHDPILMWQGHHTIDVRIGSGAPYGLI